MIKALETVYAGHRFRSRLEARWAVFFDTAGIAWQYEPQGFDIDGVPYLPDFRLPECGTWVEVKGDPGRVDLKLLEAAGQLLPCDANGGERFGGLLLLGDIPPDAPQGDWIWQTFGIGHRSGFGLWHKNRRPWMGFSCHGWPGMKELDRQEHAITPWLCLDDWMAPAIRDAYTTARQARFEHGETPTKETK